MNLLPSTRARRAAAGMTLLEVMICAAIIGLLAAISVPWFAKARSTSEDSAFMSDLRVAVSGYVTYSVANSTYPTDQAPGVLPVGMEPYFSRRLRWTEPTAIGGQWDWDHSTYGIKAAVSVFQPVRTPAQMQAIDRKLDDGDLSTGIFRLRPGGAGYMYVLEE